jgi:hypothetical protein
MSFDEERHKDPFSYPWSDDALYQDDCCEDEDEGDFCDYLSRKYGIAFGEKREE